TGGFAGGLAKLCNHFGLEIKDDQSASQPVPSEILPKAETPPVQQPKINLGKITLKKPGDTISLRKAAKIENIHVKLTWTKAVDLDLHAFYITKQGKFGHIYFGNKGKFTRSPYISLDKDAGVGNTAGNNEEN